MWTEKQLATYKEQGFLFQPGLLSRQQIDDLQASAADLMGEKDNPEEVHIVREKERPGAHGILYASSRRALAKHLQVGGGRRAGETDLRPGCLHLSQ